MRPTHESTEAPQAARAPRTTKVQREQALMKQPPTEIVSRRRRTDRLGQGLGWFSVGLGVSQLAAPRGLARMIGIRPDDSTRDVLLAIGVRELATGLGILRRRRPSGWLWARVGGDLIDLALLGVALGSRGADRNRVVAATVAVAGVTLLDAVAATWETRTPIVRGHGDRRIHVVKSITIGRPAEEVYRFWHDFENLPRFMKHLESVQVQDKRRSHWKARGPAGKSVEWDAEIIEDRPNELIAWRSLDSADVPNSGVVRFKRAPGGRGTEVRVDLRYDPPGGRAGAAIAKLFGAEPGQEVASSLRRLKQVIETGTVVHSDASIHAGPHPARPAAAPNHQDHRDHQKPKEGNGSSSPPGGRTDGGVR